MTIPGPVTYIGPTAFVECSSINWFEVDPSNTDYAAVDGILYDHAMTVLMNCPAGKAGVVTVPEGVITIADSAFYRCGSILSIELPDSVKDIGDYSFYYCRSLVALQVPVNVPLIGNYTFAGCDP